MRILRESRDKTITCVTYTSEMEQTGAKVLLLLLSVETQNNYAAADTERNTPKLRQHSFRFAPASVDRFVHTASSLPSPKYPPLSQ